MISKKRLEAAFPGNGAEIKALIDDKKSPYEYASVQALVAQCYHTPKHREMVAVAVNEIIAGYGVETVFGDGLEPEIMYINMGDTYNLTLLFDYINGAWFLCSWGDYYETMPKRRRERIN